MKLINLLYGGIIGSVIGGRILKDMKTTKKLLKGYNVSFWRYYPKGGFKEKMSIIEARRILDVSPLSSQKFIQEQYKKILLRNHPDKGGSAYIAAKINEAIGILKKK